MNEEKSGDDLIDDLIEATRAYDTAETPYRNGCRAAFHEAREAVIERLRRPSPVGRDLGSPQAGLGGPASTPSDALEAARRILKQPAHYDDDELLMDARIVAEVFLAASPSPWRSMESESALEELYLAAENYVRCQRPYSGLTPYIRENGRRGNSPWAELIEALDAVRALKPLPSPPSGGELK